MLKSLKKFKKTLVGVLPKIISHTTSGLRELYSSPTFLLLIKLIFSAQENKIYHFSILLETGRVLATLWLLLEKVIKRM